MGSIDGRETMRSMADALDWFRGCGGLDEKQAVVETMPIGRRDRRDLHMVAVRGLSCGEPVTVLLPNSISLRAKASSGGWVELDIGRLDGASVDQNGRAALRSGSQLTGITFGKSKKLPEFSVDDDSIVQSVLHIVGVLDHYISPVDGIPSDFLFVDYSRIDGPIWELRRVSLKSIERELERVRSPAGLPKVSRRTISDVLDRAYLRYAA